MIKAKKRAMLGLALTAATMCSVLGFSFQKESVSVSASNNTDISVNAIGQLSWEKTQNATEYKVDCVVDNQTIASYTVNENKADVGAAITQAAQTAKEQSLTTATVQFNIYPIAGGTVGTASTYSYSFNEYVDFAYTTHDISEVNGNLATQAGNLTENIWTPSAIYKNDLLTFGFQTDVSLVDVYGVSFFLFNANKSVGDNNLATNANYRIRILQDGSIKINNKGDTFGAAADYEVSAGTEYNTKLSIGKKYYMSLGVFDTYDIAGNIVGETVFYERSEYDDKSDSLVVVGGVEYTYGSAEVEAAQIDYECVPAYGVQDSQKVRAKIEKSGFVAKVQGKNTDTVKRSDCVFISSGKPQYQTLSAPTYVYYDNVDATLNWNAVEGATEYEICALGSEWVRVQGTKAAISQYVNSAKYQKLGYVPLCVRAVSKNGADEIWGKETRYNINLKTFQANRSELKDLNELYTYTDSIGSSYNINTNGGAKNGGGLVEANENLNLNTHVTFAFSTNEKTPSEDKFLLLKLFRDSNQSGSFYYGYDLVLFGDGTVVLTSCWQILNDLNKNETDVKARISSSWRVAKVEGGFDADKKYYVTYGVDEIFDAQGKVANRLVVRISEEINSLNRKTLCVLTYDFKYYDCLSIGNGIQLGAHSDVVSLWQAKKADEEYQAVIVANNEQVGEKTVSYGAWYDFSNDLADIEVDGYTITGWTYGNDFGMKPFETTGWWNVQAEDNRVLIEAVLTPVVYNITFNGIGWIGPTTYTTEETWELPAPSSIPQGKIFDGWYDVDDVDYANPIKTLNGYTKDITLVARMVDGFTITVNDIPNVWEVGNSKFELVAPSVVGKTFSHWEKYEDGIYVPYNGETVFEPDSSMTFRAVYTANEYSLTYNMPVGGTHSNATSYTVESHVSLKNAQKEGFFFVGWYLESTFETLISSTKGWSENLTLYPKFMEDRMPSSVQYETAATERVLFVPELPEGSIYKVSLFKGTDEKTVTDNRYVFDEAGNYTLKYEITLPNNENLVKVIEVEVQQVYTVNVYYGNKVLQLKKYAGEKVLESELPTVPDGYTLGGLFTDLKYSKSFDLTKEVNANTNIYVKWESISTEKKDNTGIIVACGAIGGILAIGGVIFFLLKKKKR